MQNEFGIIYTICFVSVLFQTPTSEGLLPLAPSAALLQKDFAVLDDRHYLVSWLIRTISQCSTVRLGW